ncbi:hypothetical protein HQ544_00750 [Candidatus Falkowbacteria bacterium]|nr:hypothetical protein [Candidatus Falkowbacteria bacterium]
MQKKLVGDGITHHNEHNYFTPSVRCGIPSRTNDELYTKKHSPIPSKGGQAYEWLIVKFNKINYLRRYLRR